MTAMISAILQAVTPDPWWIDLLQGLGLFLFFIIMVEAIVFALVTHFGKGIGWWDLVALLAMAGAAELFEFLITMRGAEKSGGSRAAGFWAIVGGIVGALALSWVAPILGSLVGAFLGVFAGAFLSAYFSAGDFDKAMAVGAGAFRGRMGAVLVKEALGVAMAAVIVWQIVKG